MPIYEVTDPSTGRVVELTGDSPPTEQELEQIFASIKQSTHQQIASDVPFIQPSGEVTFAGEYRPEDNQTTLGEDVIGVGETALTLATGATGGTVGGVAGAARGVAKALREGTYGTREAADMIERMFMEGAEGLTYAPKTQAGQEIAKEAGEVLQQIVPAMPLGAGVGAVISPAAKQAARAGRAVVPDSVPEFNFGAKTAGGAETPKALERRAVSEAMPVPFEGESALTTGQAGRGFDQLQFEREVMKQGEMGAPLRERMTNQTETLLSNFDALSERVEPISIEPRDIGKSVTKAVIDRANAKKDEINKAYAMAREAGEMEQPVNLTPLADTLTDIQRFDGVAKNVAPIRKEAARLGIIADDDGVMIDKPINLNDAELFRQFVNEATDLTNPVQARMRRIVVNAIDSATETEGGELYRIARKKREIYGKEFENTGITSRLMSTKRGTSENQIAFEDVFKKIVLDSPIEEVNKLRGTLLKGGSEGRQAWNDVKAATIQHIKDISSSKFRDLGELSLDIYTAPPGAINHSNTASALQVALDSVATFGMTGIPAPVATSIQQASRYMRDKKVRARINKALGKTKGSQK